jgi:hypothetical protein
MSEAKISSADSGTTGQTEGNGQVLEIAWSFSICFGWEAYPSLPRIEHILFREIRTDAVESQAF